MQCGGCSVAQAVPILLNPLVWLAAIATITTVVSKTTKRRK